MSEIDTKICNKCKKELSSDFFYGRNKVCKRCYKERIIKKRIENNPAKKWRCKVCGTTDKDMKAYRYRLCVKCINIYVPEKHGTYKCLDCGDTNIANRAKGSMLCKSCNSKRSIKRYQKKRLNK